MSPTARFENPARRSLALRIDRQPVALVAAIEFAAPGDKTSKLLFFLSSYRK